MYAKAFLENLGFDSITVAPYMGKDSVEPFLTFKDKHTILLALTSNTGASDFQMADKDQELYKKVIQKALTYQNAEQLMFVIGATQASMIKEIREIIPNHFLLVPGVGAQGGSLKDVCHFGLTKNCGLLVNSSRGIIYASNGEDFAEQARAEALKIVVEMKTYLV
jgi:orotidine-5'-phosphate decarboxylase